MQQLLADAISAHHRACPACSSDSCSSWRFWTRERSARVAATQSASLLSAAWVASDKFFSTLAVHAKLPSNRRDGFSTTGGILILGLREKNRKEVWEWLDLVVQFFSWP
jgi:hypothetical protein